MVDVFICYGKADNIEALIIEERNRRSNLSMSFFYQRLVFYKLFMVYVNVWVYVYCIVLPGNTIVCLGNTIVFPPSNQYSILDSIIY